MMAGVSLMYVVLATWVFSCEALVPFIIPVKTSGQWRAEPAISSARLPTSFPLSLQVQTSLRLMSADSVAPNEQSSDGESDATKVAPSKKKPPLYPKIGDIVRYYDLDGGKEDGEVLVGKISFIQKNMGKEDSGWLVELTEMDDVGEGYFAEYPSRERQRRKSTRDLASVSPILASYVQSEAAFKVPRERETGRPSVRAETYDIASYGGPVTELTPVNLATIEEDGVVYDALKGRLLRNAALAGLVGTVMADLIKGQQDAVIYGGGVVASLVYLVLLSQKIDSLGSPQARMGSRISNLRFGTPVIVIVAIALYNKSLGPDNPIQGGGSFELITPEQFGAAVLGFLTYRLPLFFIQIQDYLKGEDGVALPGSAGIALQLVQGATEEKSGTSAGFEMNGEDLMTVLVVSGPQATGRTELVQRLIAEGEGKFVTAKTIDSVTDPVNFERLAAREEFLSIDAKGRYGLTKESILASAREADSDSVLVVDADVALAKKLTKVSGLRLVGVWVGLNSVEEFEARLGTQIDDGTTPIPEDETRATVIRARIREIVQEIEYGISSRLFEFTILNEDPEESMRQLREAAAYCFK